MIPESSPIRNAVRLAGALLLLLPALLAGARARAGEPAPPDAFVRAEIDTLADLLGSGAPDRVDVLRDRIRTIADFDGFARKTLGKRWGTLSAGEQRRFEEAVRRLLESHYLSRPSSIFDRRKVSVQGAKLAGDDAEVALTVARKDADVEVVVKLHRAREGWIAVDVVIDDLSLLEDYRAQFARFLEKRSVGELVERLDSRARARYGKR